MVFKDAMFLKTTFKYVDATNCVLGRERDLYRVCGWTSSLSPANGVVAVIELVASQCGCAARFPSKNSQSFPPYRVSLVRN